MKIIEFIETISFKTKYTFNKYSRYIPPRNVPPKKIRCFFRFVAALFRFVARFARVRIEDSSGNKITSTAYLAKPGFVGRECSGRKQPGWNIPVTCK